MRHLLTATALGLLMSTAADARENWALLIGASTYDNLEEKYWLKGPENDMDLVRSFLTRPEAGFAADRVLVLADQLEGARGRATLQGIRDAFAELAAQVQPGDFVYLHFSGHGSQAPAADPSTETDGLDEIFLPVDVGPWNDSIGHVENALVDDEIGRMIDAIRARGADVFAVFDSCHSGTATRAAPGPEDDDLRSRQLPPEALGLSAGALDEAEAQALAESASRGAPGPRRSEGPADASASDAGAGHGASDPHARAGARDPRTGGGAPVDAGSGEGMGDFVYFYAAQTTETTPEKRLPKGAPDRRSQGVFTYAIFQTLAETPGITYRQLAQEVLRKYSVQNLTRTTPLFEGALDQPVFGLGQGAAVRQWPLLGQDGTFRIEAGQLHGLQPGDRLALLASPADPDEAALGWMEVQDASTFEARLVAADGAAAPPKGAVLRKAEAALSYGLTIALPEGDSEAARLMRAAAALLEADDSFGQRLRFTGPGAPADLRLAVLPDSPRPDAIWILPETGLIELPAGADPATALAQVPSVGTQGRSADELSAILAENFVKMARAINVMKLGAATGSSGLAVKAGLSRARYDEKAPRLVDEASRALLDSASVPRLIPDDVVGARLENSSDAPVDFNILYIGADYSISWMGNGRLNPGEVLDDNYVLITSEHFGRDRMVIVVTPAAPGTAVEDLSFLEQSEVERSRAVQGLSELGAALAEAGFGETTRSAVGLKRKASGDSRKPIILQYELETIPG